MNLFAKLTITLFSLSLMSCAHNGSHENHEKHDKHGKMWEKMDANSDKVVTKAEFDAAHGEMFKKMDLNGDGKVTQEEKEKHHESMKSEKKACCGGK